jgi:hypothetical protein
VQGEGDDVLSADEALMVAALERPPGGLISVDDQLDAHPCMLPLVRLVERVAGLAGVPRAVPQGRPANAVGESVSGAAAAAGPSMPDWMMALFCVAEDAKLPRWAGLVTAVLDPLTQCSCDGCGGTSLIVRCFTF